MWPAGGIGSAFVLLLGGGRYANIFLTATAASIVTTASQKGAEAQEMRREPSSRPHLGVGWVPSYHAGTWTLPRQ